MKKFVKIFVLLSVGLLYGLAVYFYGSNPVVALNENNTFEETASGQSYISEASPNVLTHIFSGNKVNNYTNCLPETFFKNYFNNAFALFRINQMYLESLFSEYIGSVPVISIQFRQVDIVFPFHYFW